MGRFLTGLVLIVGLAFLLRGFVKDVKQHQPPPTEYILHHDTRVNADQSGITVSNQNGFTWPKPTFSISRSYYFDYPGDIRAGQSVNLPFANFHNDQGEAFPGVAQFSDFDIRTATMAMAKRR